MALDEYDQTSLANVLKEAFSAIIEDYPLTDNDKECLLIDLKEKICDYGPGGEDGFNAWREEFN